MLAVQENPTNLHPSWLLRHGGGRILTLFFEFTHLQALKKGFAITYSTL